MIDVNKFNLTFPSKETTNHLPCLVSTATLARYHQPLALLLESQSLFITQSLILKSVFLKSNCFITSFLFKLSCALLHITQIVRKEEIAQP